MTEYEPSIDAGDRSDPVRRLDDKESWELLRSNEFGRLAYHLAGEVHIVPINYATDGEKLYFRTAEGSKLLGIVMNEDVAFEIDEITDESATSVVLRGRAELLEGQNEHVVENLPLRPWVPTLKFNVVSITPAEMSGRSFNLHRPWNTMRPQG
ncbi:MAG: pyridoxamine 5'-phosphate oxidase family protein [Actinomycetia bacterium]|nr:pyridoxamine 5'-phosphate oxidase family protein [Actinomycetes bacterium]